MKKKQVIAYLHTHWDREWYREYEIFRLRLLRVFDNVLEMLEANKIPCFYFDGQVCALEDYLELRPENTKLVKKLISEKKLFIGPFYCLIDEFLTDEKCFRKNLELGLKFSKEFGCEDFIAYFADTFGHSQNVIPILKEYGIDKAMVWRGCGDIPANFLWGGKDVLTFDKGKQTNSDYVERIDTVNLVRGYFMDIFSANISIEEKAQFLNNNLDMIAEKSRHYLLLPIGADHLGVETDIAEQIEQVNNILDRYEIKLSSPFDYFEATKNLQKYVYDGELLDNSKTFVLKGCHSSRLDLKHYNQECSYKLDLANKFVSFCKENKKYDLAIEYAYKLLIKNQAHDGICGCSTDDVHRENIIRYKKILQIAETIIGELKFKYGFNGDKILNLLPHEYTGVIEFKTDKSLPQFDVIKEEYGFPEQLLIDTQRIPITEDYNKIYTYVAEVKNVLSNKIQDFEPLSEIETDLFISKTCLGNSKIYLTVEKNCIKINGIPLSFVDYKDNGDSYNFGPEETDKGTFSGEIVNTEIILDTPLRASLKIEFPMWDKITVIATLDKKSGFINLKSEWNNTRKNHILQAKFDFKTPVSSVMSEDMNVFIKRTFDTEYEIREHLPTQRGIEAKINTAPMQRAVGTDTDSSGTFWLISKGLTQYEVNHNSLLVTLMRATGAISNPANSSRSTPAGPPLPVEDLQSLGENKAEFNVYFGDNPQLALDKVYNGIII